MKPKQKVDLYASILFLLNGVFLLLCPLLGVEDINILFLITMGVFTIVNVGKFLLTRESKDYEGLYMGVVSLGVGIASYFYPVVNNTTLVILLLTWITLVSLIKLKKADYYNDRKSKLWILEIAFLILFILIGILTSINFQYANNIKILMLGFFFFIHGILEFIDPIIIYLTKERIK